MRGRREDTDEWRKQVAEGVRRALDSSAEAEVCAHTSPAAMLLSRSWLRQWKAKACKVASLKGGSVSPTQSIACHHGRLLPEKRRAPTASSAVWHAAAAVLKRS